MGLFTSQRTLSKNHLKHKKSGQDEKHFYNSHTADILIQMISNIPTQPTTFNSQSGVSQI
jgi:hypothetical protein